VIVREPALRAAKLDDRTFRQIVRHTPLVSIDLIVLDDRGRALLGLRAKEPARGFWFVCGGRIRNAEPIIEAFDRIATDELGWALDFSEARSRGVYEHLYPTNRFEEPGYGTHYVVLAYEISQANGVDPRPDHQHSELKWWSVPDLLASPVVHTYTKAYFR
jgi:colanic acid biosynthesis protein WcaH